MALLAVRVERIDQDIVAIADKVAAYLAGTGQFTVIGIELFMQDQETPDLRIAETAILRQVPVDLVDA